MVLSENLGNVLARNWANGAALLRQRRLLALVLGSLLRSRRLQVVVVEASNLLTLRQLRRAVVRHVLPCLRSLLKVPHVHGVASFQAVRAHDDLFMADMLLVPAVLRVNRRSWEVVNARLSLDSKPNVNKNLLVRLIGAKSFESN